MKKLVMKKLVLIALAFIISCSATPKEDESTSVYYLKGVPVAKPIVDVVEVKEITWLDESEAKSINKPMIIYFYRTSNWSCMACDNMDKVLQDKSVINKINKDFAPVRLPSTTENMKKYQVRGLPMFKVFSDKGEIYITGYKSVNEFLIILNKIK